MLSKLNANVDLMYEMVLDILSSNFEKVNQTRLYPFKSNVSFFLRIKIPLINFGFDKLFISFYWNLQQ